VVLVVEVYLLLLPWEPLAAGSLVLVYGRQVQAVHLLALQVLAATGLVA
jgi:hypothetical protein